MGVPLAAWKGSTALGCHPGNHHYTDGSLRTSSRANAINLILEDFGLDSVSASEGRALPKWSQRWWSRQGNSVRTRIEHRNKYS